MDIDKIFDDWDEDIEKEYEIFVFGDNDKDIYRFCMYVYVGNIKTHF